METDRIVQAIISARNKLSASNSLLVAMSGIDGSGKSFLASKTVECLKRKNFNVVLIGLDAWHTPSHIRFNEVHPAEHFYKHAFRFDDLFELVVNPLKRDRSVQTTVKLTRLPENDFYTHTYNFTEIDVIVLEGIFLLKRHLRENYDLAFWIECSFETALQRAVSRNQEGLTGDEIIRDYETIYFPAQRIHFAADDPKSSADEIIFNDSRLVA